MITICYILICRKLKNYYITYIHKYIDEYIDVLCSATTQTDQTGNLVI